MCNAGIIPAIYFFYPETADRSLEDIERFFRENHEIFVFKNKEATSVKRPVEYAVDEQNRIRENEIRKGYEGVMVQHVEEDA